MNRFKVMIRPAYEEPFIIKAKKFSVEAPSECVLFYNEDNKIIAAINYRECVYVIQEED